MSSTHTIAWQNLSLTLPTPWNLHRYDGNHRRGALIFRDLRTTRLELRWQPRSQKITPDRILQKRLAPLKKKSPSLRTQPLSETALLLHHKVGTFLLALTPTHLTELYFPKRAPASPDDLTPITTAFLDSLNASQSDTHLWSVYGATGLIPASARLKHTSLLPGSTTLTFAHEKSTITLGALSLADRLLQDLSLQEWAAAAFPLIARLKDGTWTNSPLTFTATTKRLLKIRHHTLTLTHDPAVNQIQWTHVQSPDEQLRTNN